MAFLQSLSDRLVEGVCGSAKVEKERRKIVPMARGRVLEIGIGSGLNLPLYDAAKVEAVVGVDPNATSLARAERRRRAVPFATQLVCGSAEQLELEDASFDTALVTFCLCSIPDPTAALREVRRVLKPSGRVLFLEHGLAPDPGVSRWQRRLTPLWRRLAAGCHLDRDVPALLAASGFRVEELSAEYLRGIPKVLGHGFRGWAVLS